VVALFLEQWGQGTWEDYSQGTHEVNSQDAQPREAATLRLCIDKALWKLGWKPGWNTTEAVRQTARWYKRFIQRPDTMHAYSLEQIRTYESILSAGP
jgi:CDP-glucose 4,6-dehydratase